MRIVCNVLTKPPLHLEVLFISLSVLLLVCLYEIAYWTIFKVAPA